MAPIVQSDIPGPFFPLPLSREINLKWIEIVVPTEPKLSFSVESRTDKFSLSIKEAQSLEFPMWVPARENN